MCQPQGAGRPRSLEPPFAGGRTPGSSCAWSPTPPAMPFAASRCPCPMRACASRSGCPDRPGPMRRSALRRATCRHRSRTGARGMLSRRQRRPERESPRRRMQFGSGVTARQVQMPPQHEPMVVPDKLRRVPCASHAGSRARLARPSVDGTQDPPGHPLFDTTEASLTFANSDRSGPVLNQRLAEPGEITQIADLAREEQELRDPLAVPDPSCGRDVLHVPRVEEHGVRYTPVDPSRHPSRRARRS